MVTRKEIREMRKALSGIEEIVRQKTLQILRNTPNKEQAAAMIARLVPEVIRHESEPLRNAMLQFRDESRAKEMELEKERAELEIKHKAELARLDLEMKQEDEDGEEWKHGGARNI